MNSDTSSAGADGLVDSNAGSRPEPSFALTAALNPPPYQQPEQKEVGQSTGLAREQFCSYLPIAARRQLRKGPYEEEQSIHRWVQEGLDILLAQCGPPSLGELAETRD